MPSRIGCAGGELAAYLHRIGVRHLAAVVWDRPQTPGRVYEPMYECRVDPAAFQGTYDSHNFHVHSYLYGVESDTLHLSPRTEVWRSEAFRDGAAQARYLMFELPDPGEEAASAGSGSQPSSAKVPEHVPDVIGGLQADRHLGMIVGGQAGQVDVDRRPESLGRVGIQVRAEGRSRTQLRALIQSCENELFSLC